MLDLLSRHSTPLYLGFVLLQLLHFATACQNEVIRQAKFCMQLISPAICIVPLPCMKKV